MENSLQRAHQRITDSESFRRILGLWRWIRKPWSWWTIFNQITVLFGNDLWACSVCWEKSVIFLASGKQGVCNLMNISGASTSIGDIFLRLWSGETNHGARVRSAAAGRNNWLGTRAYWWYLVQGQRLLGKFGRGHCWFRIFCQYWCQLSKSMPWMRSREGDNLVAT